MAENYYSEHTGAAVDAAITKAAGLELYQHNIVIERETADVSVVQGVSKFSPTLARFRIQVINSRATSYIDPNDLYTDLRTQTGLFNRAALISAAPFTRVVTSVTNSNISKTDEMTLCAFDREYRDGSEYFCIEGWINVPDSDEVGYQMAGYIQVSTLRSGTFIDNVTQLL